ncbi:MAG TPA: PqiC family protein [Kiritimatiellia bacterium]|nr:PqiC family protein [Kiritimatiellia bacterium]HMP35467.1 PqiC family protein [Kiritimatiellia bacterium]
MKLRHLVITTVSPILLLLAGGCATSPAPDLYVFSAEDGWRTVAVRDQAKSAFTVRFAPVNLPAYLDRPLLVVREGDMQIRVEQFHRWGIPLNMTVVEILGASIARDKPDAYVDVVAQRAPPAPGYLVHVDIVRLDGELGGDVELIAQWRVTRGGTGDREVVAQRLARYEEPTSGKNHAAYVDAIRKVLARMGTDIAAVME